MTGACSNLVHDGVIRGVLGAVDCQTRAFAEAGYSSLTSASSSFQVALTALLTIYVALVGFRMLLRVLEDREFTPQLRRRNLFQTC